MRDIILRIRFDEKECVRVPLSDFSGGGIGAPKVDSWYVTADGNGLVISRWVMPYKKNAVIIIENHSDQRFFLTMEVDITHWKWTSNTLYYHCNFREGLGIPVNNDPDSDNNIDWNFTTIKGRGIYRGDLLSLYNYTPDWYGEGDEKIWVDNDTFPSHFGTGTEDYYNCSWAPVVPFQTPFGGAPRADEPSSHGYNAFVRTRNLDAIPFNRTFRFDIEMLSWHKGKVDYYTTCYWYGDLDSYAIGTSLKLNWKSKY